jgi:hypothetical protein
VTVKTWAVVPSNGRAYLQGCLQSLSDQVEGTVIVANGEATITSSGPWISVVPDTGTDKNISRWWNIGLDEVARLAGGDPWNVLIVNDDVVCPPHLVRTLAVKMDHYGAVMAYPNQWDDLEIVWREAGPVNLHHRITGYCFMLSGASGLRLDEKLAWWYGDDSLFWSANKSGGSVLVPGCAVTHLAPNGSLVEYPELQAQAGRDRQTFVNIWGRAPW